MGSKSAELEDALTRAVHDLEYRSPRCGLLPHRHDQPDRVPRNDGGVERFLLGGPPGPQRDVTDTGIQDASFIGNRVSEPWRPLSVEIERGGPGDEQHDRRQPHDRGGDHDQALPPRGESAPRQGVPAECSQSVEKQVLERGIAPDDPDLERLDDERKEKEKGQGP